MLSSGIQHQSFDPKRDRFRGILAGNILVVGLVPSATLIIACKMIETKAENWMALASPTEKLLSGHRKHIAGAGMVSLALHIGNNSDDL